MSAAPAPAPAAGTGGLRCGAQTRRRGRRDPGVVHQARLQAVSRPARALRRGDHSDAVCGLKEAVERGIGGQLAHRRARLCARRGLHRHVVPTRRGPSASRPALAAAVWRWAAGSRRRRRFPRNKIAFASGDLSEWVISCANVVDDDAHRRRAIVRQLRRSATRWRRRVKRRGGPSAQDPVEAAHRRRRSSMLAMFGGRERLAYRPWTTPCTWALVDVATGGQLPPWLLPALAAATELWQV